MIKGSDLRANAAGSATALRAQFLRLVLVLFAGLALACLWLFGASSGIVISLVLFGVIAVLAGRGLSEYPLDALGAANIVTTTRAALIALLAGSIVQPDVLTTHGWLLFGIAMIAFAMDGIDGFLARRDGTATRYGARFDMEIDALFGAVLSLIILSAGIAGPLILILGFTRYVFVGASYVLPWLNGSLPESMRRKVVCVVQIATLIALICPLIPTALHLPITLIGVVALIWSFAVDTLWLKRAAL